MRIPLGIVVSNTKASLRGKRQVRIDMGLVLMANNLLKYNKRTTQN